MTSLYYVQDGSTGDEGWCTSRREAIAARAAMVRACGAEYADAEIETHDTATMRLGTLERLATGSTRASVAVRQAAARALHSRTGVSL